MLNIYYWLFWIEYYLTSCVKKFLTKENFVKSEFFKNSAVPNLVVPDRVPKYNSQSIFFLFPLQTMKLFTIFAFEP